MPWFHLAEPMPGRHGPLPAPPGTPVADASLFRAVFENTLEAVVITDASGRVLQANAEACYLFGRTLEQMRSSNACELVDATDPRVTAVLVTVRDGILVIRPQP